MPWLTRGTAAQGDLIAHYVYLAEEAGAAVAERFLEMAEASFATLADQPKIGAPVKLHNPVLSDIRKWRVKDFDRFLIFYQPRPTGVHIVRVLHTSQDWWQLLDLID